MNSYHYTDVFTRKDTVFVRGYSNGKRFKDKNEPEPFLFVPSAEGDYKTLQGETLKKKTFQNITSARDFLKQYEHISNFAIYGNSKFLYQYINEEFPGEIQYDPSAVKIAAIDMEVESEQGFPNMETFENEIISLSVVTQNRVFLFGLKPYTPKKSNVQYFLCKDEKDLIKKFLMFWNMEEWSPDIITGWNIVGFDIPYLYNRIKVVLGEKEAKKLSPWGIIEEREGYGYQGQPSIEYLIRGMQILDYLELYKKFSFTNHESYALKHISHVELGRTKVDWSEFQSLTELYAKDPDKFYDYNIDDSQLVIELDGKLGFIGQILSFAYDAKINFIDTLATVNVWDVIITNYLLAQKIAVPQYQAPENDSYIIGGHVKEPKQGLSKWVVSFDFSSLYPHIVMGWNISPETFYKKIDMPSINNMLSVMSTGPAKLVAEQSSCSLTAHGCLYRNNKQGFFPALMEKMFNDRVTARKKLAIAKKENQKNPTKELQNEISRLDNLQKARKIQINAGYGAMANKWFRFFNADMAESVTSTGQFAIQFTENKVNAFLNKNLRTKDVDYVIASDTDSLYITLEPIINKTFPDGASTGAIVEFCDKVCSSTIEPFLEQCFVEFTTLTNAFAQKLSMKREVIADKAIWRKAKHYIMNVWDKEGLRLKEPETLIHGIEAVRSSTPMICRNKIKDALKIIMNGTENELQGFIQSFRNEFFELPFEDIAFPRSMSHLGKYSDAGTIYIKATPIHVKGALVYNHWVKENELEKKLELVHNGNKVKFCYLSLPNPMKCNVLATPNRLPQEMQFMNKYLNRDQQFIKAFLDPIQSIIELIDWKTTKSATLESFFT